MGRGRPIFFVLLWFMTTLMLHKHMGGAMPQYWPTNEHGCIGVFNLILLWRLSPTFANHFTLHALSTPTVFSWHLHTLASHCLISLLLPPPPPSYVFLTSFYRSLSFSRFGFKLGDVLIAHHHYGFHIVNNGLLVIFLPPLASRRVRSIKNLEIDKTPIVWFTSK